MNGLSPSVVVFFNNKLFSFIPTVEQNSSGCVNTGITTFEREHSIVGEMAKSGLCVCVCVLLGGFDSF